MQFWQLSRNFFDKRPKILPLDVPKWWEKVFLSENFTSCKYSYVDKNAVLTCPPEYFSTKSPKFFTWCPKKMEKIIIFSKTNYFHSKCPLDAWGWVLTTPPKISTKRRKNFVQRLKRMIFFRKRISSKFSPWHLEHNFDTSAQTYWDERRKTYRWFTNKD